MVALPRRSLNKIEQEGKTKDRRLVNFVIQANNTNKKIEFIKMKTIKPGTVVRFKGDEAMGVVLPNDKMFWISHNCIICGYTNTLLNNLFEIGTMKIVWEPKEKIPST